MQEKIGQSTVNYGFMFYCETNLPVVLLKLNDVIKYILPTLTCLIIVQQILLVFGNFLKILRQKKKILHRFSEPKYCHALGLVVNVYDGMATRHTHYCALSGRQNS